MAQLCFACQTTARNDAHVCATCGRNLAETKQAWARGDQPWREFLNQTGWYPGRSDEWVEHRWVELSRESDDRPQPPSRLVGFYLGGHPSLSRSGRVVLTRDGRRVVMSWPGWRLYRPPSISVPLDSVRSVTCQRTTETSLDDAVMTAAIGGARTGPLGVALAAAIGRRRRVVRTVHVDHEVAGERLELMFRPLEDQGEAGMSALVRMFSPYQGR